MSDSYGVPHQQQYHEERVALAFHSPQQLPERYFAHPCGCLHVCLSCPLRPWDHVVNDIHINWRQTQKEENSRDIGTPHRRHHHYQSIYLLEKKILCRSHPRRGANVIPRTAGSSLNNNNISPAATGAAAHVRRFMRNEWECEEIVFLPTFVFRRINLLSIPIQWVFAGERFGMRKTMPDCVK